MDDNFQKSIVEITEEEQQLDKYAEYVKLIKKSLYTITATLVAAS